jgi:hypothetical protein
LALTRSVFELGISYLHQNWSAGSHKASEPIRFRQSTPGAPCAHALRFRPFWPNSANFYSIHFLFFLIVHNSPPNKMTLSVFSYHPLVSGVFSKYGVWCSVFGLRCLVSGGRRSVFGVWRSVFDVWCLLFTPYERPFFGVWRSVFGVWFLPLMKGPFLVSVHMPNLAFLCSERALDSKQFER